PVANPTATTFVTDADAGTYAVTVTDANGCVTGPDTIGINVHGRPSGILDGDTTICLGGTARLHISADGVGTVYGTLSDGSPYSGTPIDVYAYVTPVSTGFHTYSVATMHDDYCPAIAETDFFSADEGHVQVDACTPVVNLTMY